MHEQNASPDPVKLIVRVAQDLVRRAPPYEQYADLKEDLKTRLARLRIPYDSAFVSAALDRLELGGAVSLVVSHVTPKLVDPVAEPAVIDKRCASQLIASSGLQIRTMPPVTNPHVETPEELQAARERAWEMGIEL